MVERVHEDEVKEERRKEIESVKESPLRRDKVRKERR